MRQPGAGAGAERLEAAAARWPAAGELFAPLGQRADDLAERLPRALAARAAHSRADLAEVAPRLRVELVKQRIERGADKLAALWRLADLAHPERPLARGFVRVTDRRGKTLMHAHDAREARSVDLHFADGRVAANVGDAAAPVGFRPRKVERRPVDPYGPQPGLFDGSKDD